MKFEVDKNGYKINVGRRKIRFIKPYRSWKPFYNVVTTMQRFKINNIDFPKEIIRPKYLKQIHQPYTQLSQKSLLLYCIYLKSKYHAVYHLLSEMWGTKERLTIRKNKTITLAYLLTKTIEYNRYVIETTPLIRLVEIKRTEPILLNLPQCRRRHWESGIQLLIHFLEKENKYSVRGMLLLATLMKESNTLRIRLWNGTFTRTNLLSYASPSTKQERSYMLPALHWYDRIHQQSSLTLLRTSSLKTHNQIAYLLKWGTDIVKTFH